MKTKKMLKFAAGFGFIVAGAMVNEEQFKLIFILLGFLFIYFADNTKQ